MIKLSVIKTSYQLLFPMMFLLSSASCGYHFSTGSLPFGIHQVWVTVTENRTAQTGIESVLANAVIDEFTHHGQEMATGRDTADAVLEMKVRSLATETISRKGLNSAFERRVDVSIHARLIDPDGNILWAADDLMISEAYPVMDDKTSTEDSRTLALVNGSKKIAETLYQRLTELELER